MFQGVFQFLRRPAKTDAPAMLTNGARIYAIGDVHGRLDCLLDLEDRIRACENSIAPADDTTVIFLGDYIDRGPQSREVIEHLLDGTFAGLPARHLMGNHEDAVLAFLEEPAALADWLVHGGMATLASYGVRTVPGAAGRPDAYRDGLAAAMPLSHLRFLQQLELSIEIGDYLFVHAGIRPGRPVDAQSRQDLLTIRDAFLLSRARLPRRVVHGHTVLSHAVIDPYRVSLDTGAYATGRLTCAMLQDADVSLLQSAPA